MKIIFQNKNVSYYMKGEGKVVVFLHGFTERKEMWNLFVDFFSKSFCVLSIDLPGHGETDSFSTVHTMEFMAEVVRAVLVKEMIQECTLVGHSMGGYVALAFAQLYEDSVNGIVLFHSGATADNEELRKNRDRLIKIIKNDKSAFVNSFIPSLFAAVNRVSLKAKIDDILLLSKQTTERGMIAALEGMKLRTEKLPLLKRVGFPMLFIVGKQDSRIPLDKILPQIALPKRSYSLILDHVGHMGFIEAERETLDMLFSFACSL